MLPPVVHAFLRSHYRPNSPLHWYIKNGEVKSVVYNSDKCTYKLGRLVGESLCLHLGKVLLMIVKRGKAS